MPWAHRGGRCCLGRGRRYRWLVLVALLGACSDEAPQGQVIARVNGADVTRRELMTELRAQGDIATTDVKAVQGSLVQRLIDRKLLAIEARKALIDRSPDYQAERRRMEEMLLASHLSARLGGQISEPGTAAIDHYIATNPHKFALRESLLIDQLHFDQRAIEAVPRLGELPTLDAVASALTHAGIDFHRQEVKLDMRVMDSERAKMLKQWLVGKVILTSAGAQALIERRPIISDKGEQRRAARIALVSKAQSDAINALATRLRRDAMIRYQPGFAPVKAR